MQLTIEQRDRLSEKIIEWGNLIFAGSVLQQLVVSGGINTIGWIGLFLWVISLVIGVRLL